MAGFSNITGDESIMFADNASFDGTERTGKLTTNGQLWIGSTAAPHVKKGTITSPLGTVTIGYSSPNITIDVAAGTGVVETLTGNTGVVAPVAGNINTVGTGSITIAGSGNTLTTQLTGLTNNAVLYGLGTATIGLVAPTNNGVLTTGTSGTPVITALASNGQLIIGSGSGAPLAATLTPGTGITITNAANSITISATGGSFAWVDVTTATQALSVQTGYVTDHTNVAYTLPATAILGDQIRIVGKLGSWSVAQNAGQQITVSSASSTVGVSGSVASTNVGDCMWLVCITAGASTIWRAESFVGNLTVT
jgi:hypothetical protein